MIFENTLNGCSIVYKCSDIERIIWPVEEGMFIETVSQLTLFYEEIQSFIDLFDIDAGHISELMDYQKNIVKAISAPDFDMYFEYDWHRYFSGIQNNDYTPLIKRKNRMSVKTHSAFDSLTEYAVNVVWYGRKGGQNLYSDIEVTLL